MSGPSTLPMLLYSSRWLATHGFIARKNLEPERLLPSLAFAPRRPC
jgi:hypothetical protein